MTKIHRKTGVHPFESFGRDERIRTTTFHAEQALTRDEVPVNVDGLIIWDVHDPQKAALATPDDTQSIDRMADTSLREMIASSMLAALLCDRRAADRRLCEEIGRKATECGVTVRSVEIRDVAIPAARQAEGDARFLHALRLCRARHRVRRCAEGAWALLKRSHGVWPAAKGLI